MIHFKTLAIYILAIELIIFLVTVAALLIINAIRNRIGNNSLEIQSGLRKLIVEAIQKNRLLKTAQIPRRLLRLKDVLIVLEGFAACLTDPVWQKIKLEICRDFLSPRVKKLAGSLFWTKRLKAARILALNSGQADKDLLLKLLKDSKYVIRIVAARAIVQLQDRQLIGEVLWQMSKEESPLALYPFRDALIRGGAQCFKWIEEILAGSEDLALSQICLDILSTRIS